MFLLIAFKEKKSNWKIFNAKYSYYCIGKEMLQVISYHFFPATAVKNRYESLRVLTLITGSRYQEMVQNTQDWTKTSEINARKQNMIDSMSNVHS